MPTSPASAAPTWGAGTRAVHAGRSTCPTTGAILTPIHQTATYVQAAVGQHQGYTYSRCANPTITALEGALADLSSAPGSPPPQALAFKTGLAAITTLFLATLAAGDHVVCGRVVYGGTVRLLRDILAGFGVEVTFVDATDVTEVRSAVQDNTKLLFVETPANPTLEVCDLAELEGVARAAGALFAVDNTFLTGHLQSVLGGEGAACTADVEVLSTTKFVEGHDSTTGGALVAHDPVLFARLELLRGATGSIQAPFDAWLTQRGITTLPLRLERHAASALELGEALLADPRIARVSYPFLPGFQGHALARRQQRSGGGVLSFELATPAGSRTTGTGPAAERLLAALELCSLAENLGAAETLVTHPATMTHSQIPPAERERLGITDGLVRLSVGLEDPADLLADLGQALDVALGSPADFVAATSQPEPFVSTGQSGGVR